MTEACNATRSTTTINQHLYRCHNVTSWVIILHICYDHEPISTVCQQNTGNHDRYPQYTNVSVMFFCASNKKIFCFIYTTFCYSTINWLIHLGKSNFLCLTSPWFLLDDWSSVTNRNSYQYLESLNNNNNNSLFTLVCYTTHQMGII